MKIALATTWNSACGISDYSLSLYNAFTELGHEVSIIGSTVFPLLKKDEPFVARLGMPHEVDVLHIQYSTYIFTREYINKLLIFSEEHSIKRFVTFHDQMLYPGFDYFRLNGAIAHRDDVFKHLPQDTPKYVLNFGVNTTPVRIMSFGLGRNKSNEIKNICDGLGYVFMESNWKAWKPQNELMEFIKSGDGTVLYYPENKGAGSSSAARFAIGARRPLFVNDVEWFKETKGIKDVYLFKTENDLKKILKEYYFHEYIEKNNWLEIAKQHLEVFNV